MGRPSHHTLYQKAVYVWFRGEGPSLLGGCPVAFAAHACGVEAGHVYHDGEGDGEGSGAPQGGRQQSQQPPAQPQPPAAASPSDAVEMILMKTELAALKRKLDESTKKMTQTEKERDEERNRRRATLLVQRVLGELVNADCRKPAHLFKLKREDFRLLEDEETVVYESDSPTFNGALEDAPKIPCLSDKLATRKWQFVTPKASDDDSDKIEIFLDCGLIGGVFVFTVADNMMTLTLNPYVTFAPPGQHTCEIHL